MDTPSEASSRALLDIIRQLVTELRPTARGVLITLDSSLDQDLGFDSLGRMELLFRIERTFGTHLPEQAIATAETPRDLWDTVLKSGTPIASAVSAATIVAPDTDAARAMVDDAQTLGDVLDRHVAAHPHRTHIIFAETDDQISYALLHQHAQNVAAGLQALGLKTGQTVAIMLPTSAEYFYSFFGILLAGGVPVPIYPPVRLSQIEDHLRRHANILHNALVTILITGPEARAVAQLLKSAVGGLRRTVTVPELTESGAPWTRPATTTTDIAFLQYTSGSTGTPKGVILTHANLLANIRAIGLAIQVDSRDVFVSWLPLYHDMGLIGAWLGSLYHSVPLVIMSPLAFLAHPERWLWAIHRYHGTLSAAPNFAYELCLRKIGDEAISGLDLSSWRRAFNGAEAVSADTITRFQQRFGAYGLHPEAVAPVYGLAECTVALALPPPARGPLIHRIQRERFLRTGRAVTANTHDPDVMHVVACGQPLPGHEIRIVNTAGQQLFDGTWLRSGDRAYMADGDVFLTGRTKDIIIRAGRNLYPHEIEEAVAAIPGIRRGCVAVFGSADRASGTDRLVVLAETRETATATRERLHREIHTQVLALLGEPADDIVLAAPHTILKTSSGKIRRAATRAAYEKGGAGDRLGHNRWWPSLRLAWAGAMVGVTRLGPLTVGAFYALYVGLLFLIFAPLTWAMTAVTPRPAWAWRISHVMARLFVRLTGIRFEVHGLTNLPPDTPCVLVANHASYLDGIVLIAALAKPFSFVAKRELGNNLITDVYLQHIGTRFVERFRFEDSMDGLKQLLQAVRGGQSLIFFPEGTFYPSPGLLPFRMGAFVIAAQAGVPVVAIAIRGSRSVLRDQTWLPRYGAIAITISPPILPPGIDWPAALIARDAAREAILRHCGERDAATL
ncbi:MAG: AMP-binding protein [Acidiferrobacter sp.]